VNVGKKIQNHSVKFFSGKKMSKYQFTIKDLSTIQEPNTIFMVASGDLRLSANKVCWPAQEEMESHLSKAFEKQNFQLIRAHSYDPVQGHGFIWNQRMGMDIFVNIPKDAPLVVATAVWQYSYHVLAGLRDHQGPILTVANWNGQWPGLVGLLNLNGCLTKMGKPFSTIWSENFQDDFFVYGIKQWLKNGSINHDLSHVKNLDVSKLSAEEASVGSKLARELREKKAIIGVFDEGCMGMYNAIIEDELLNELGIYKERISQSALFAEMRKVKDEDAIKARKWLDAAGMTFITGENEETELTDHQIIQQLKMYIAAVRMADFYGCDAIGIQYQQGLKDICPASDLAEGLLNNPHRPPVYHLDSGEELFAGNCLPHFNEVDEGAAIDSLVTNRVWSTLEMDPSTTLHDIRWGRQYCDGKLDDFVWVFEISGAAPASHFVDGYKGAVSERQPPMYFPLGGGTLKGVSKPGEIVWSRVYIEGGVLHADLGRGEAISLPEEEVENRWQLTTQQWPIMNAILHGVNRNQMMAQHKANHIQIAYATNKEKADKALAVKAAMFSELGVRVHLCGEVSVN
jgi:hypothetical protein